MDGGLFLGSNRHNGLCFLPEIAKKSMKSCGEEKSIVASIKAVQVDTEEGNNETLNFCSGDREAFLPLAVVNLATYDVDRDPISRLKDQGFCAVGLFPSLPDQVGALSDVMAGVFAKDAQRHGMPVQLGVSARQDFAWVAAYFGGIGVPVMLRWMRGQGYSVVSEMVALARSYPNFLFDISAAPQLGGVEWLCRSIGAHRLFLASNAPFGYEHIPYFLVHTAEITEADKEKILSKTLACAIGADPSSARRPDCLDTLLAHPKIDTHHHTGKLFHPMPKHNVAAIRGECGEMGADVVASSSNTALFGDVDEGNKETLALVRRHKQVAGMIVVVPGDSRKATADIDAYAVDPRFVGVKTIQDTPWGLDLDAPEYVPILAHLEARGDLPVMTHPPGVANAARRFPRLNFVVAHSTWRMNEYADLPNVYCDIATSTPLRRETDLSRLLSLVGPGRVLYATDAPLFSPALTLGKLAGLALDGQALGWIFGRTARKAFPRLSGFAIEMEGK